MNYLLIGSESYNLRKRREQIQSELNVDVMNISVYPSDSKVPIQDVIADCQTLPFFADNKLVILEKPSFIMKRVGKNSNDDDSDDSGADSGSELSALIKYLDAPSETTTLIIYIDEDVTKGRKEIRQLSRKMKTEYCEPLKEEDFRHYVIQDLNNAGIKMDPLVVDELISRLPLSVENWKRELEKLKLYPDKLTKDAIKQLVPQKLEDDVFRLSDGVVRKNLSQALSVFNDLMLKNRNDVYSMVGLLAFQFRFMCQCKALSKLGMNQYEIARELNAHEYRIKMSLQSAGSLSPENLLAILDQLAQLDQNIKQGKVDPQAGLEMFIIRQCRR